MTIFNLSITGYHTATTTVITEYENHDDIQTVEHLVLHFNIYNQEISEECQVLCWYYDLKHQVTPLRLEQLDDFIKWFNKQDKLIDTTINSQELDIYIDYIIDCSTIESWYREFIN